MMTSFMTTFMGSATNLALPSIGREFSSSALVLSWIVSGFILAAAAFLLPMGRAADIVGRKRVFLLGTVGFTALTLLCGLAWSNATIVLFRICQGIAASMIYATGMAILSSVIPADRRGKAMGLAVTATYTGLSVGPVLGGVMCQYLGWRSIFYFTALTGTATVGFARSRMPGEWTGADGETFDIPGSVLYMTGLVAVLYGMSTISRTPWGWQVLMLGVALLIGFVAYEMRTVHPLMNLRLFRHNVTFGFSNLAAMLNYGSTFAIAFLISLYLQVILDYSPQAAGFVLLSQPIIMAIFSSCAGALSDRIEPRIVASLGMGLNALGLFNFVFLGEDTAVWMIVANLVLIGFGYALFSSPNTNAIMGSVEERFYGVAASTVSTMRMIGMAMSMAIVTLFLAFFIGNETLHQSSPVMLMKSFRISFVVFSILCLGGVFASLARGRVRAK